MNPNTGEIKRLPDSFVPHGWIGLPMPGEEVEVVMQPDKRRGLMWRVVEVKDGDPGKMVLEPVPKTVIQQRKRRHVR